MATIDGNTRVFQWKFVKLMCYICEKHLIYCYLKKDYNRNPTRRSFANRERAMVRCNNKKKESVVHSREFFFFLISDYLFIWSTLKSFSDSFRHFLHPRVFIDICENLISVGMWSHCERLSWSRGGAASRSTHSMWCSALFQLQWSTRLDLNLWWISRNR